MANILLAYLNAADAARGATGLVTEDGDILLVTPAAGGGSGAEVLIFPTIAAMSAFPAGTLPAGQPAVIESNGSVWSLQPTSEGSDGITVATATGSADKWLRTNENVKLQTYLSQRTWVVDPVAGNDEAAGLAPGSALKHYAEIYRRWGNTWEPNLVGVAAFLVQSLSTQVDATDPTNFAPFLEAGASFQQLAPVPAPSFTGTLNSVNAKTHGSSGVFMGNALESTFTTTTGAIVSSMVLVNTTRGNSRAMAVTDLGGGNWLITQPLTPYTPGSGFPASTEVNTWGSGDAIQGFAMVQVDIARVGARAATFDGSFNPAHLVQDIAIIDGNGNFGTLFVDSGFAAFEDCPVGRPTQSNAGICVSENCGYPAAFQGDGTRGGGAVSFTGCFVGAGVTQSNITSEGGGSAVFIETILLASTQLTNCPIESVYVHTGASLTLSGDCRMFGAGSAIYGNGLLNVPEGCFNIEAATGTAGLPVTTVQLNGQTTAYSYQTVAGTTTVRGPVGLTGANLDAAAGPAGFGGFAFAPGAVISLAGVQP